MKKIKNMTMRGFTLVELLIVISLISILAVAVLATINPIEQANKARDAKFLNDAAEILNAYERYYASLNTYPWGSGVGATTVACTEAGFGVLDGTSVFGDGVLISTAELKSSFKGRAPFVSGAVDVDLMYTYNDGVDSNYVCYVPKARANRSRYSELKCLTKGGAVIVDAGGSGCVSAKEVGWATTGFLGADYAYFLCVPENPGADVTPVAVEGT